MFLKGHSACCLEIGLGMGRRMREIELLPHLRQEMGCSLDQAGAPEGEVIAHSLFPGNAPLWSQQGAWESLSSRVQMASPSTVFQVVLTRMLSSRASVSRGWASSGMGALGQVHTGRQIKENHLVFCPQAPGPSSLRSPRGAQVLSSSPV